MPCERELMTTFAPSARSSSAAAEPRPPAPPTRTMESPSTGNLRRLRHTTRRRRSNRVQHFGTGAEQRVGLDDLPACAPKDGAMHVGIGLTVRLEGRKDTLAKGRNEEGHDEGHRSQ